jgi:hypothetical protein
VPAIPGEFGPTSFPLFFLVAGIALWGVFGTVLVRWICSALNGIWVLYQLAETERRREALARKFAEENEIVIAEFSGKPPTSLSITTPNVMRAFGMVFANALVIGIAALAILSFKTAIQSNDIELHPSQVIGLVMCGLLTCFAILWINRQVLLASWTSTVVVTATYLMGTLVLTASVFRLVQFMATNL